MKKVLLGCGLLILVVGVVFVFGGVGIYNKLVTLEEKVKSAWSQVENVYQRRADLVPNLVETVKGAKDFEKDTFTAVTEARSKVGQVNVGKVPTAGEMQRFQSAQDGLSSALSRLLMVVENYPQLKATENFRDLQVQLEGTENRIAVERKRFNEVAQEFNTARRRFPTIIFANFLGFQEKEYFQASEDAKTAPKVKF